VSPGKEYHEFGAFFIELVIRWAFKQIAFHMICCDAGCRHVAKVQFVAYALLSKFLLYGQIYLERSRTAQPHLNAEELGSFIILLPPRPEQEELVSYLDSETDQSDALMERIKDSINLLREYRTALISAAVTGKIDVREEGSRKDAKDAKERNARE